MQFRIRVQSAAAKPFVPVADRPADHIAKHIMIEMQVKRDTVVETYVLCIDRVTLYHACCKCDDPPALAPQKETNLIPHTAPKFAKILLRQLLEVQFRALIYFEIQGIGLRDHRRHVIDNTHLDGADPCCRLKLLAQLLAGRTVKCALHVIFEACVVDAQLGHGQAGDASESMLNQTVERRSISCRKLLEYNQMCPEPAGMSCNC